MKGAKASEEEPLSLLLAGTFRVRLAVAANCFNHGRFLQHLLQLPPAPPSFASSSSSACCASSACFSQLLLVQILRCHVAATPSSPAAPSVPLLAARSSSRAPPLSFTGIPVPHVVACCSSSSFSRHLLLLSSPAAPSVPPSNARKFPAR